MAITRRGLRSPIFKGADTETTTAAVRKLVFKTDTFTSREAVEKWLSDNGWEGHTIEKTDAGFEAVSETYTEDSISDVREVEVENGILGYVGRKSESTEDGDADDGDKDDVEKGKYKDKSKDKSKTEDEDKSTKTEDEIIAFPPEADELLRRIEACGVELPSRKAMYTVSEFGYVLSELKYVFNYAEQFGLDEADVKALKAAAKGLIGILAKAMASTVAEFEEAFKAQKAEKPPEPVQAPASGGMDISALAAVIKDAITAAVDPVNKRLDDLAASVDNVDKAAKAAKETAERAAKDAADLSNRHPTKKAAPETVEPVKKAPTDTEINQSTRALRNAIGFMS